MDTLFQIRLRTLGLATPPTDLDKLEDKDLARGLDSLPFPATSPSASPDNGHALAPRKQKKNQNEQNSSPSAAGELAGPRAEPRAPMQEMVQSEIKNAPSGASPQVVAEVAPSKSTDETRRGNFAGSNSRSALWPGNSRISQVWARWNLRATWGTLSRSARGFYKKDPNRADEGRAIRRGTIVAVLFALAAGGLAFGTQHHEPMQPLLYGAPGAPRLGSPASMQPPAPPQSTQISRVSSGKASLSKSGPQHDPEYAGKQLQLPHPLIDAKGDASSPKDAQNRAEEQQ